MASSRKRILETLAQLNNQLHRHQKEAHKEQSCIQKSIEKSKTTLPLLLIPALVIGWKMSKKNWFKPLAKQLLEIGSLTVVNSFKNEIIKAFKANLK